MEFKIYSSDGDLKLTVEPKDSSTQAEGIQAGNVLNVSFILPERVMLEVNDYADFLGRRYWLTERYRPVQKSTVEWEYSLKLFGLENLISRFLVLNTTDGIDEPVFSLTAPPREHVALIVRSINDGFDTSDWKVGIVDGADNIVVDYHGKYCDEGLKAIADATGSEYWIEGTTVNLCRCEHGERVTLGYRNGLTKIQPDVADNAKVYTRLFPTGSSRNIDPVKYGHSRLQLPHGARYVDINTDRYGIIHHYEENAFAGIFPRYTGTVSSVRSEERADENGESFTVYYFKDENLPFDTNEYEIGGLVKRVTFQEGSELAGLGSDDNGTHYFEVNFDSDSREFEIITRFDDSGQLPGGVLVPKPSDRYIPWNMRMPDEYYALAEAEYLEAVNEYNLRHCVDVSCFKAPTDYLDIEERGLEFHVGQRVRLESEDYFPETGYKNSRITKITRKINRPSQMDLEICDALSTGALEKIKGNIDEVKAYVQMSRGSLPDIIRTGDGTRFTDSNLLSALRTLNDFISKTRDDRTPYDLAVGGMLTAEQGWQTKGFVGGLTGLGGMVSKDGDGKLRSLMLREWLEVPELRYNRVEISIGNDWAAPGGGIIESVEPDVDPATGQTLRTGTVTLHLEDGEIGAVADDDICQGIFHDGVDPANNSTVDSDDGRGNFLFSGFHTVYFRITDILETGRNSKFRYMLRPTSANWLHSFHPSAAMHFVGYGNFTKKDRQNSRYSTRTYERYLRDVADWEFGEANIAAQFGDLSNLTIGGVNMYGYSAYLDNIYMSGTIKNITSAPLRMEIDLEGDNFISFGETKKVTCRVYKGWDEVTADVTQWAVSRDSGIVQDDAAWALKQKVKDFAGMLDICFTAAENDIGSNSNTTSTLFTFTAKMADPTQTATYQLAI